MPDQYNSSSGVPLTRAKVEGQSLNSGAVLTMDVPAGGTDFVTVEVDMNGAAVGDLVVTVVPYEADGLTLANVNLGASVNSGPALNAGKVTYYGKYDVAGIDKVQLQIKNNNVGAQVVNRASWRTASW